MKKSVKFGGRKRYEEGGEVEEGKRAKEYVASKAEGERSSDEPLEQVSKMVQKKKSVVTKEEMQKAGFDNLRDYLNAQRGLTRRGEKSTTSKSTETKPSGRETAEENLSKRRPTDLASSKARYEGMKIAGERSQRESDAEKARESRLGSSILARDRLGSEPDAYIVNRRRRAAEEAAKETSTPSRTFGAGAMSAKGLGGMSGFAKGGKVGLASKRADGIAQRGKTRGKMM